MNNEREILGYPRLHWVDGNLLSDAEYREYEYRLPKNWSKETKRRYHLNNAFYIQTGNELYPDLYYSNGARKELTFLYYRWQRLNDNKILGRWGYCQSYNFVKDTSP